MAVALLLALALSRPYHVETVASLATSRHTHVEVTGQVTLRRREADGDWHLRISDAARRFIVAEIVPTLIPVAAIDPHRIAPRSVIAVPRLGDCVRVRGIRRQDTERGHGWPEIHPVEQLAIVPCGAAR